MTRACTTLIAGGLALLARMAVAQTDVSPDLPSSAPIQMGVRPDVAPFVWRDPDSQHYRGFFWDICTEALKRANYDYQPVQITAAQRAQFLACGRFDADDPAPTGCPAGGRTLDLLCDPTTITLRRMQDLHSTGNDRAGFGFSPILFLANGAFVQQDMSQQGFVSGIKATLIRLGHVTKIKGEHCATQLSDLAPVFCPGNTAPDNWKFLLPPNLRRSATPTPAVHWPTACATLNTALSDPAPKPAPPKDTTSQASVFRQHLEAAWMPPQIWPEPIPDQPLFQVWGHVRGATIAPFVAAAAKRAPGSVGICIQEFDSHEAAAKAFCSKKIYRYFGDVELVRGALEHHRAETLTTCPVNTGLSPRGTYEPYALVMSRARDDFAQSLTTAVYSLFTDGTVMQLFNARFGAERETQYLSTLFSINRIPPGEDTNTSPTPP